MQKGSLAKSKSAWTGELSSFANAYFVCYQVLLNFSISFGETVLKSLDRLLLLGYLQLLHGLCAVNSKSSLPLCESTHHYITAAYRL